MPTINLFLDGGVERSPGMLFHEATKLHPDGPQPPPVGDPALLDEPGHWMHLLYPEASATIDLSEAPDPFDGAGRSGIETLMQRRSIRRYGSEPMTRVQLAQLLALAYPPEVSQPPYRPTPTPHSQLGRWKEHVTLCKPLALVLGVAGVPNGAYFYNERARALHRVRDEDPLPIVRQIFFQAEFLQSAVIFLFVGSLWDALQRYGDRGYRYLLLEDGVLIQRLYLAASTLGLSGCTTGSLTQRDFDEWLGLDGHRGTVINAFAAGPLPADPPHEAPDGE